MGIGANLHTAGIFPQSVAGKSPNFVEAEVVEDTFPKRITLTLKALGEFMNFVILAFGKEKKEALKKVLDEILKVQEKNIKDIKLLDDEKKKIETAAAFSLQKVGLVKYNPFNETGGDHSFSLALLDGQNSGILITGLHTREKTRIYVKSVKKGETNKNLSNEEKKALASAGRVENLE